MIVWCLVTIAVRPEARHLPSLDARPVQKGRRRRASRCSTRSASRSIRWASSARRRWATRCARRRSNGNWLSLIGVIGIIMSFGHSILAMSGEETLAQVYREVESPKLKNFKRAALVVFLYSMLFTSLISFFAVMIIPDDVRMSRYSGNLIGGLAMNVVGPQWARLILNGVVVIVGSLILSGAVNTAIVGSNGVLNRVSEDGVLPDWFLKPHPRFGTSSRLINLVVILQIVTILASRGNVLTLGEAYAFGVVWSFVFMSMSMLVLRFKRPEPREYEVPLNIRIGRFDLPIGMTLIFLTLAIAAIANLLTKEVATITGVAFTAAFYAVFWVSEHAHRRRLGAAAKHHEHLEQFNEEQADQLSVESLHLTKPYRKLVAIRSPYNLGMLERCLAETDPETTEVVVMTASVLAAGLGRLEADDHRPRPPALDGRGQPGRARRQAGQAGDRADQRAVLRHDPHRQDHRRARADHGAVEQVSPRGPARPGRALLDEGLRRQARAAVDPGAGQGPRRPARHRRRQPDPQGGRRRRRDRPSSGRAAQELARRRAAAPGLRRQPLERRLPRHRRQLPRPGGLDHPARRRRGRFGPRRNRPGRGSQAGRRARRGAARALGRHVEWRVARGEAGPEIVRTAVDGKFDAIFMSLRGVYRRGDTTAFASNTRYVLEHAPCRVILGFAPKSIPGVAAHRAKPASP